MSALSMHISLADSQRRFLPGDFIQGKVQIKSDNNLTCNKLTLRMAWAARGRGDPNRQTVVTKELFTGKMRKGDQQHFNFDFEVPNGPYSYQGKLFSVQWLLIARADIANEFDNFVEQKFFVGAGSNMNVLSPYQAGSHFVSTERRLELKEADAQINPWPFRAVLLVGFSIDAFALWFFRQDIGALILPGLIGIGLAGVGLYEFITSWRKHRLHKALGSRDVLLTPQVPEPGQNQKIRLLLTPQRRVQLKSLHWRIKAREMAVTSSQNGYRRSYRSYYHTAFEKELTTENLPQELSPATRQSFEINWQVPHDAPLSFASADNSLQWWIDLEARFAGLPTLRESWPMAVMPGE